MGALRAPTPQLSILRKAGRYKLAAPVLKTGSASPRSEHLNSQFRHKSVAPITTFADAKRGPTPSASLTIKERNPMKPSIRYQSQLLFRKSYKPNRLIRLQPAAKLNFS